MITFYAAVGSYRIKTQNGSKMPFIQKLGKLYPISIPEFVIWSTLLWEVMTYDELKKQYESLIAGFDAKTPAFDELLEMLLKRKLIVRGLGYTGSDALFNMLSNAFIIPYCLSVPQKAWTVLRLWLVGKLTPGEAFAALKHEQTDENEDRVSRLIEQTPLSTAEIVRCFDRDIYDVSTPEKVIAGIYPDEKSDQFHIANEEIGSNNTGKVMQAVANLYLSRKIVFEVV